MKADNSAASRRGSPSQTEAVARVKGTSVNALIVESLQAEIARVRKDEDVTARAGRLLKRDKALLDRLGR